MSLIKWLAVFSIVAWSIPLSEPEVFGKFIEKTLYKIIISNSIPNVVSKLKILPSLILCFETHKELFAILSHLSVNIV